MNPADEAKAKALEGTMHHKRFLEGLQKNEVNSDEITTGQSISQWPEFQAFMRRLGIDVKAPILNMTIEIPISESVRVVFETRGADIPIEGP